MSSTCWLPAYQSCLNTPILRPDHWQLRWKMWYFSGGKFQCKLVWHSGVLVCCSSNPREFDKLFHQWCLAIRLVQNWSISSSSTLLGGPWEWPCTATSWFLSWLFFMHGTPCHQALVEWLESWNWPGTCLNLLHNVMDPAVWMRL